MKYIPLSVLILTTSQLLYLSHRDAWPISEVFTLWAILAFVLFGAIVVARES